MVASRPWRSSSPDDLDQILDNLIDNAIAYAPGPIEIDVEDGPGHDLLVLGVRDHGPGVAPDERARVTERFFRGKGVQAEGSGLGLAIARELVERWNGSLTLEDADGDGTRVEVNYLRRILAHAPLPGLNPSPHTVNP